MLKIPAKFLIGAGFTAMFAIVSVHAELVRNPTAVGASFDLGQITKGVMYKAEGPLGDTIKNQVLTRTGVYLTESGTFNERLQVQLTVGGLFWFALPAGSSFQTKRIQFGPGVGQAQGIYSFGSDVKNPVAKLQFGLFPVKYSESVNLGEYLYRSGTYPGTIITGGWSYINSASYMAQGVRVIVPVLDGKLTNEFTMFMERDLEPTNDLTPGYLLTAKPTSFLELGGGVVWAHAIYTDSKRLSPKTDYRNSYNKFTNLPATSSTSPDSLAYYTFRGFKTMARASMDIGSLIKVDGINQGDFKLYAEMALLGVADKGFYYNKMTDRMPLMAGIDLPTFKILDQFAFEFEYYKSKYPNTIASVLTPQSPIPLKNDGTDGTEYETVKSQANYKWTLYLRRHLASGMSLYAQAANDHSRSFDETATPANLPATSRPSDWYYIIRLEFGI